MSLHSAYPHYDQSSAWFGVDQCQPNGLDRLWNPPVSRVPSSEMCESDASQRELPKKPQISLLEESLYRREEPSAKRDPLLVWGIILGGLVLAEMYFMKE